MESNSIIFGQKDGQLNKLFEDIKFGDLGLPDLQRPFVWGDNKVRDLFDSMYRGFPIGYFLFWETGIDIEKFHHIGREEKENKTPKRLIIDGQQRLTALYSIFKNKEVLDKEYKFRKINLSFNPITEEFKVVDASTKKNKEYIEDISSVFNQSNFSFITAFLKQLESYGEQVSDKKTKIIEKIDSNIKLNSKDVEFIVSRFNQIKEPTEKQTQVITSLKDNIKLTSEEIQRLKDIINIQILYDSNIISHRIEKLSNLINYPFQAVEINASVDEEIVAEIFTRINSKGTTLNQADFVLTLISVFWEEGRKQIDIFCENCKNAPDNDIRESPFNHILEPDAQDIVRVTVGLGFKRGRMKDAYLILKGRDLVTRKYSDKLREEQFRLFKEKQQIVLNNTNWHNFLKILIGLGFKSEELISSKLAVIYSYTLYLIGKEEFDLDYKELETCVGKWFFMSNLTERYSSSPESQIESDLNKLKNTKTKAQFKENIEATLRSNLTNDFWEITLPNDYLVTSSAKSPAGNTYFACLNKINANVLFSNRKVNDVFDPSLKLKKKTLERHHLFPAGYLKKMDIEQTLRNQIANMTYLEFQDNIHISDDEPKKYFFEIKEKYFKGKDDILKTMMKDHCIPNNFYELDYQEFLNERRKMMAKLIKEVFEQM